ncbi:hypothetical protein [Comamonas sp. JC664]|uniref:hypothetical protein n=1 Tax=Comamonas sp. JC664 TaxID=2801917 RepID=UPI00191F9B47|nr:hypothetical protein [Comamonas sp. JC664]MBL0694362.1 hypothetical protein [Comamonas sp. JC664]GHG77199.1 hypothetical protein GCM10012319_26960 [Comamonas sp. KCTC 72670]
MRIKPPSVSKRPGAAQPSAKPPPKPAPTGLDQDTRIRRPPAADTKPSRPSDSFQTSGAPNRPTGPAAGPQGPGAPNRPSGPAAGPQGPQGPGAPNRPSGREMLFQTVNDLGPMALQTAAEFGPAALHAASSFGPALMAPPMGGFGPAAMPPPMDAFGPALPPPPMGAIGPGAGLPPMGMDAFGPPAGLPPMGFGPAALPPPPMGAFGPGGALPPMGMDAFGPPAGLPPMGFGPAALPPPPMGAFGPGAGLPPMGAFGPGAALPSGNMPMGPLDPVGGFEAPVMARPPMPAFRVGGDLAPRYESGTFAPRGAPKLENLKKAPEPAPEPTNNGVPSAKDKRPAGDKRTAAQIVDDTPVLKNLGRQKDIKFEQLCKQTGIDPKLDLKDAKQNPDAVYRLAKVLEFIDSAKASTGDDRSNKVKNGKGDGNIEGITKSGDARHGTEAGMVKDFAEQGYSFLGEHQLPTTKDTHVKADGSNKDNFQWFAGEAGKHLWFLPGVSNVLTGIGNSEGGVKGVFEGAAKGYLNTIKGAAEGVAGAFTKGRINPASLIFGAATGALANTEAAPQPVKDIASML